MRLQQSGGWRSLLSLSILTLQWSSPVWAKKEKPSVHSTPFDFIPYNVNYFEDSDTLLFEDGIGHNVWRSTDAGVSWHLVDDVPKGKLLELVMHSFDRSQAYIITDELDHYKTSDRGKTWVKFHVAAQASIFRNSLKFHAGDHDRVIFNAMSCAGVFCEELTFYTTNGFKDSSFLRDGTSGCFWAKSTELFTTTKEDLDNSRILCVAQGRFSPFRKDYRLVVSDNFFQKVDGTIQEFEPELEQGRTVQGIVNLADVKGYLIVAASAENTDEMALYVTQNTLKWHRAMFPHDHKLTEEAYTVLESTNYSIQIDVMNSNPKTPMGVFFSSNSNGTYFSRNIEHTNRNTYGLVDFEKMSGIQGIIMVNEVENWQDVENKNAEKKIVSKISFDDGRTWNDITTKDDKKLHLHSVDDLSNSGRVFSSPAPGLAMGVGNTGNSLGPYEDGDTWLSEDAGLTWRKVLDGPHKYEFGDQGSILVAIKEGHGKEIVYSLNHGVKWHDVDLPEKIRPVQLTTTSDSTSLKFLLEAVDDKKPNAGGHIITLDFGDMHEAKCTKDDMEKWYARRDDKGEPSCLMGHKQWYWRRKADADCFVDSKFEDPEAHFDKCECTDADFECDYNFIRNADRTKCELAPGSSVILPEGACKASGPDDTFKGPSGWRKIPGNECEKGEHKDDPVTMKCDKHVAPPASGNPVATESIIKGDNFVNKVYLERTGASTGQDETVLMRTEKGVFLSENHGKDWHQILSDEAIDQIYPHPYFNDMVFFVTPTKKVFYSTERGRNIRFFEAPDPPNKHAYPVMSFHPKNKDWIIWNGLRNCDAEEGCHSVASVTKDRGDSPWKTLQRYVHKCEFIKETETRYGIKPNEEEQLKRERLIYCSKRKTESNNPKNNPWELVSSTNFFDEAGEFHFDNVIDFATMSEFIVVATKDEEKKTLKVDTSVDGKTFAEAKFPHGFNVDHQQGYTVLDSSTHSVFLHVTVNNDEDREYGSIIKSNSNGTFFSMSLDYVDRDTTGYVDFEKMLGIEGVALVNVVANAESKDFAKEGKKLKTMITHNDGAQWSYLKPPPPDKGISDCKSNAIDKCSLNIHGYTERSDKSHTYSSASAIGLMLGTGNVGEYLADLKNADTFMTADAGLTWKFVRKGKYMWEFGDQGSVVVIVEEKKPTNTIYYTLDEGDTWKEFVFSEKKIEIDDITTVPSDNSRKFLLWGYVNHQLVTINLDFSGLTDVQCKLDENDVTAGDYELWKPQHPSQQDDCLFGHVSQYHRKKKSSTCYNGRMIPHLHDIEKNCPCSRRDYECDFNYERQPLGECALVKGFSPPDHSLMCQKEGQIEYFVPTGYRKISISTCDDTLPGALPFDKDEPRACAGKEDEFNKKHSASAAGIFFAITIPIAVATGVGYYIWKNWANKFGQIRLGEQGPFDSEAPYIKYPVLVIAAIVAALQAAPLLISSLWRSASSAFGGGRSRRFTTRDSFARGRGDYAIVDEDEGELLGEDSDEEV